MSERPIWRPNSVSPELWNRLSREEQIQYWKADQDGKPTTEKKLTSLLKSYRLGHHKDHDFAIWALCLLTEKSADGFLAQCSEKALAALKDYVATLPPVDDDEAWKKTFYVRGATYSPNLTAEELSAMAREEKRAFREGVRLFRKATEG